LTQEDLLSANAHNSTGTCNDCNVKIVKNKVKAEGPENWLQLDTTVRDAAGAKVILPLVSGDRTPAITLW